MEFNKKYSNYDIGEIFDENGNLYEFVTYVDCDDIFGEYPNCCELSTEMYKLMKKRYYKKLYNFLYEIRENDECSKILAREYDCGEKKILVIKRDEKFVIITYEVRLTFGREDLLFVTKCNNLKELTNILKNIFFEY